MPPSGPIARKTAALVLGLLALPGCSLVFQESAATSDGGGLPSDAALDANVSPCGVRLEGTIGHFPLDGEGGKTALINTVAETTADSVTKINNILVATPLAAQAGPTPECGEAAALSGQSGTFVRVLNENVLGTQSVDFWFNIEGLPNSGILGALLSKEEEGNGVGDLGLYLFREASSGDLHHVLLRLQDGAQNTYFACSETVPLGEWNHVAVSFDEFEGAKLFVNGKLSVADPAIDVPDAANLGSTVCGASSPASTATLGSNPFQWLWGAGSQNAPGNVARDIPFGALDELRFRNQPFTLEDAEAVYSAIARR